MLGEGVVHLSTVIKGFTLRDTPSTGSFQNVVSPITITSTRTHKAITSTDCFGQNSQNLSHPSSLDPRIPARTLPGAILSAVLNVGQVKRFFWEGRGRILFGTDF